MLLIMKSEQKRALQLAVWTTATYVPAGSCKVVDYVHSTQGTKCVVDVHGPKSTISHSLLQQTQKGWGTEFL